MKESIAVHDAHAIRLSQLIGNSARSSKKRLFPLESAHSLRPKKVIVTHGTSHRVKTTDSDDDTEDEVYSDNSRTTLGETSRKSPVLSSLISESRVHWKSQCILGSSSVQPLRLLGHNYVGRRKNYLHRFVGDQQPATELDMANLFGAHPAPSVVMNSAPSDPIIATAAGANAYYEQQDESLHLAGTDVELPSTELLKHIESLCVAKVLKQCKAGVASRDGNNETESQIEDFSQLERKFDQTALVAVGILIEELVRDIMVKWYKSGAPLGFDPRALRTEALAQMNGAASRRVTFAMLQNQLEVLFNRDLKNHSEDIKVFHRKATAQERLRPKPRSRQTSSAKNNNEEI